MANLLERVVPPPAMSLEEMRAMGKDLYGDNLGAREAEYDAIEVFGQSASFRDGFQRMGLRCQSFDYRD